MHHRKALLFVGGVSALLFLPCGSASGQRSGGARGATGGARGLSTPRSGLTPRSNPIANPAPSLTPHEVLNPRGSLSTGQVLNPSPSINRPRSGGALPATNTGNRPAAARYQSARPAIAADTAPRSTASAPAAPVPAGENVLFAVVALDGQLAKVAPDKGWSKRLSLDQLRAVPAFSEQPADDSPRMALEKILKTYEAVASEDQSANISELPEFKKALAALQDYLMPIDVRKRKRARRFFQQLSGDLMWYKNGAPWVEYLVPAELTTSDDKVSVPNERVAKLLRRFDKLVGDPVYKKVTSLPGFSPAHEALKVVGTTDP